MQGVLIVAHGSKDVESNETFFALFEKLKSKYDDKIIAGATIKFRDANIENGIINLIEQGVTEIKIVPYLLFMGNHFTNTIPSKVSRILENHPNVKVTYSDSLGNDSRIINILADKIES